jgi:hypothetical protein
MLRLVALLGSLLLTLGALLVSRPALNQVHSIEPVPLDQVDQGIALVHLTPAIEAPITTAEEAQAVLDWWREQPVDVTDGMQADALADRHLDHLAYIANDGSRVVLQTDAQGLVATCRFDAHGSLLSFERNADARLPMVLPYPQSPHARISARELTRLATGLARLETSRPSSVWLEDSSIPGTTSWEQEGDHWICTITHESPSGHGGTSVSITLDAQGILLNTAMFGWRGCGCGTRKRVAQTAILGEPLDPEPALPMASN